MNLGMQTDLVLIRGIMSSSSHWMDFEPMAKARFPKSEVYTPDILGNGLKYQTTTPLSIRKNIDGLRHQVGSQYHKILIGFSLGGMLASQWALAYPGEVLAIVLINCSFSESPIYKRFIPKSFAKLVANARHKDLVLQEQRLLKLTSNLQDEQLHRTAHFFSRIQEKFPTKAQNFPRQLYLASRISLKLKKPATPVLVLNSLCDQVVHPHCSEEIAKSWGCKIVSHPTAGHDLTLDDPAWVIDQLQQWLIAENIKI